MSRFEPVIGLEVHAQLKTNSKLFCKCSAKFGAEPNENVCEVCSGMPGVLPVLNARAVEYACKMAMAVDCTLNKRSIFARKQYFYPDLPKNYQISQYEEPYAEHGHLDIETSAGAKRVGITRIHMEEDAGKSIHGDAESYVDLNRTGTPLIEIVSEPDMRSAEEAVAYLKRLHEILVYLDICDGNMEEGSFRCDANVSIRPVGQEAFGTRAELKNLNSFRNVARAIEVEIERQEDLILDGEKVVQETRLYDAEKNTTQSMRGKEEAHDYRYVPDPDIPPLFLRADDLARWRGELPELPLARRERFVQNLGLSQDVAEVLCADRALADYYEAVLAADGSIPAKKAANWCMGDLLRVCNEAKIRACDVALAPVQLAVLIAMVESGEISAKSGKDVFEALVMQGGDPKAYVEKTGLVQISDTSAIEAEVDRILAENPTEVEAYKGGKKKLIGFFVGQIMRATKGQANPGVVNELLKQKLES